jgi:anti-sigma factor RsiW
MRTCALFDNYRDNELDVTGRREFESHMAGCDECRTRMALLDAVVHVLQEEEPLAVDLSARIADRIFRQTPSWENLIASWFRPRFALAFLGMIMVMTSFLWMIPGNQTAIAYSEYMQWMEEAEASNLAAGILQVGDDSELVVLLEGGGDIQ